MVAGIEGELEKLSKGIKGGHVVFDCENVGTINSLGIRAWKNLLEKVAKKATIEFQRCSSDFVDAANLVSDITVLGVIASFYATLGCASCGVSHAVLLASKDVDPEAGYGSHKCRKCAKQLTAEVDARDFLAFLDPLS